MSVDDYNVEPTGTLGLTADELVSVGNEFIFGTTPTGLDRDEKLFTSTISRPISWVPVVHNQESIRTDLNRQRPGNALHPKRALTFRYDYTGSLVRMPNFVHCNCDRCQETVNPADSDEQSSAKRKPIPSGEGSRDSTDVPTLTDVTTRPPMYDAGGAERLGAEVSCPSEASPQAVEVSCPSEASPQAVEMSCPSEASSQDVRPVVSTADAMTVNTNGGLNQLELSKVSGVVESEATTLIL